MTTLNALIQAVQTEDAERERRKKEAAEQEKEAARVQSLADFDVILNGEFTPEFRAALNMQVVVQRWYEKWQPEAIWVDEQSGAAFSFSVASGYGVPRYAITGKHNTLTHDECVNMVAVPGQSTKEILRVMATLRDRIESRRQIIERNRAREKAEQQYRADQAAAEKQADLEIRAELEILKETTPLSWTWKEGVTVTFM